MCRRFIKNHHLGDKCIDAPRVPETADSRDFAEVLFEVARVIRLVKILREDLEEAVIVRFVAALERIDEHEAPAGLQDPGELAKGGAAHLRRQFMEHENAGYRILA